MEHNDRYLDFSPISRSINVVDISLTKTKVGFPAWFGFRQPSKRFKNTRLFCRALPHRTHGILEDEVISALL